MSIIQTWHPGDGEDNGEFMPLFKSHGRGLLCSAAPMAACSGEKVEAIIGFWRVYGLA